MAKRRSSRRPPKNVVPPVVLGPSQPAPAAEEKKPRRLTEFAIHLVKSAGDFALQHVWQLVGGAIVASLILPLWLYIKGGKASWLHPWFKYAAAFVAGWVSLSMVLIVLSIIQRRRRLSAERVAKNAPFVSNEKGFLDHIKNQKRGWKEFNSTLRDLPKLIADFGKIARQASRRIDFSNRVLGAHGANFVHGVARRTGKKLNKRSAILEQMLERLDSVSALLLESNLGYVRWFTPNTPELRQKFENDRNGMVSMLDTTREVIPVIEGFRTQQASLRGLSQDLNTAVNRMEHATTNLINFLRNVERDSQQVINEISAKLD